mmetsp:Transcript_39937/g.87177  ORF Transcript_39937/g.87177 Transcript_39937/m.87177 type:complete len:213 (+) Transcript_39937:38-676(+)
MCREKEAPRVINFTTMLSGPFSFKALQRTSKAGRSGRSASYFVASLNHALGCTPQTATTRGMKRVRPREFHAISVLGEIPICTMQTVVRQALRSSRLEAACLKVPPMLRQETVSGRDRVRLSPGAPVPLGLRGKVALVGGDLRDGVVREGEAIRREGADRRDLGRVLEEILGCGRKLPLLKVVMWIPHVASVPEENVPLDRLGARWLRLVLR